MNTAEAKPIEILLVEDNPGDIFLTQRAFKEAKIANNIQVAEDGEQAMNMLLRANGYEDILPFDIVLLDLNLPKKDGKQVLREIKSHDLLRRVPVVVLTSSKAERDIVKSYDLQASSYIVKPLNLEKFNEIVNAIENFWFKVVVLPPAAKK